jgi:hypothetical protein
MAIERKRSTRRRWVWAAGIGAVLLGSLAVTALTPAEAALPGARLVSVQSASDSTPTKSARADCPSGMRVTGGGGRVAGASSHVVVTRMQPVHTNNADRFEVTAAEDETAPTASWAVTAIAVCANAIGGMEIVERTEPGGDTLNEGARADCPAGKVPSGGGGRITGGQGQVQLLHTGATVGPPNVFAQGLEDPNGFAGDWTVTAYAVCVPSTPGTSAVRTKDFGSDSQDRKVVTASCPAGMSVTGGAAIVFTNGENRNPVVESVAPSQAGGAPGRDVTVIGRENTPTAATWSVTAVAYCHS